MGTRDLSNSEDILIKVDQNNLIYIDPNSVLVDGEVEPRGIKQENLVIYVNLQADLVPRSILATDNQKSTLVSIAKGNVNFLKNNNGDGDYDTSWTNAYNGTDVDTAVIKAAQEAIFGFSTPLSDRLVNDTKNDSSGQSFGIESIYITTKGFNAIPQITINFVDVRGKTLFESPQDSPYRAFFHLPWPIFYLTVKGYYGKAIKYRLHLVKFNTKFNESNGNFEVTTNFVGSTYAYLNDIPLQGILNSPYMYMVEYTNNEAKYNENTGTLDVAISKSSKGYQILESVYKEYKQKGLIDKNFPVKTLREVIVVAESLDRLIESEIFGQLVDMEIFAGVSEYDKRLIEFSNQVDAWGNANLSREFFYKNNSLTGTSLDVFNYPYGPNKTDISKISGTTTQGTIQKIIIDNVELLNSTAGFANKIIRKENNTKLTNNTKANFSDLNAGNSVRVNNFGVYVEFNSGKQVGFNINLLKSDIYQLVTDFQKKKDIFQKEVEQRINTIVRDPEKGGIGFEPTIRNIFAVVLANAEVYIRLLKDVHTKAFDQGPNRKSKIASLQDETPKLGAIYPWPEIKKSTGSNQGGKILAYPGDPDLVGKLQSNDYQLWPEVEFLENYQAIATKKYDTLTNKEGGIGKINFIFPDNFIENKLKKINTLDVLANGSQFLSKTLAPFLYEIYERSYYVNFFETFEDKSIVELANLEFKSIQENIKEDNDLIDILKGYITSVNDLYDKLRGTSPFERWPYLQDSLPTTPYIKDILEVPYTFEQYVNISTNVVSDLVKNAVTSGAYKIPKYNNSNNDDDYPVLNDNLKNYIPEPYRVNIYPFNSNLYLDYINQTSYDENELKFNGSLKIDTLNGFISSPLTNEWFKNTYSSNVFLNKLYINQSDFVNLTLRTSSTRATFTHILNTPYFHKQLYSDFTNSESIGKYAGSAYLLLNSLPFYDLEDTIPNVLSSNIKLSAIYREIGATHFIPYHLLVKWGGLYHRYKKYLLEGVDILSPILGPNNTTTDINTNLFFDNNTFTLFTISGYTSGYTVDRIVTNSVGIHPYYDAIFHEIVNGYNHYDILSGNTSFYQNTIAKGIIEIVRTSYTGIDYWTSIVDNSKYDPKDLRYTILPCDGFTQYTSDTNYQQIEQRGFRIIWDQDEINHVFSGYTFPSYGDYNRTFISGSTNDNIYGFGNDYRKIIDLIGTFSPDILNEMEEMFLSFSSKVTNEEIPYKKYDKVKYYKFQELLKDIVTVKKESTDVINPTDQFSLIQLIKTKQQQKLQDITNNLKSYDNIIQFTNANPKELDPYVLINFSKTYLTGTTFTYRPYDSGQLTQQNLKFIELYLGEDISNKYLEFFLVNDIELSEENILQFRPLIYIYAGKYKDIVNPTNNDFLNYLSSDIVKIDSTSKLNQRQLLFLRTLLPQFAGLQNSNNIKRLTPTVGFGDTTLKLELYSYFKSFNDKWVAGNSLGQRLLLEEFLFLDKANKDIGDEYYFNIQKLIPLDDPNNQKQTLYGVISMLLQDTGFYMRAMPAYVNFYGTNFNNKSKPIPSKNVAKNLFGTFLEVDYQDSYPKMLIQYTGPTSKILDLSNISKDFKFQDDSFDISKQNNNPLIITTPKAFQTGDLFKSNRVVAFEVNFGDQNQSIFKGIQLDQASIKNTTESMIALENLARSESGSNAYQVDIGLFEIFRQASYTCTVSCLGNVMIQPTMYFYLKNIPMFKGTYWITDVSHNIRNNTIQTTFTGTRIPKDTLPDPKESFMASYKPLFDSITNKAIAKLNETLNKKTTEQVLRIGNGGSVLIDTSGKSINGEEFVSQNGIDRFQFYFNGKNGEKYVQRVRNSKFNNSEGNIWYRALVVRMGGENYKIEDNVPMSVVQYLSPSVNLKWSDVKDNNSAEIFSLRFIIPPNNGLSEFIQNSITTFVKADSNNKPYVLSSEFNYTSNPKILKGPIHVGPSQSIGSYGIAMSGALMNKLGLVDNDVVYFIMKEKTN